MPSVGGKRKQPETSESDRMVALHRARIVEWAPTAITALAATADATIVAAARESGSIEIWNTEHWQCIKRIPGRKHAAISSLAWTREGSSGRWRLFSGGLDGALTEWDLEASSSGSVSDSFGGAVWSLAAEPGQSSEGSSHRVAVACDDGALRIFEAQDGVAGLQYVKTLPRTEGRVLSAAWHPDSNTIVTGTSSGVMHVWELTSNRELLRMTAGSGAGVGSELCVWSIMVLPDGTMVSGDSTGTLQFWDGQHGTLLQAFTQHKADILAVAASKDGNIVFATGIDVQVACFRRLPAKNGNPEKWLYLDTRRPHTHDVRAMLVLNPVGADALLVTGANDAQLFAYSVPRFQTSHPVRVCKVPQRPGLHLAAPSEDSLQPVALLAVQPLHVDLWQTGCTPANPTHQAAKAAKTTAADLTTLPTHIVRIQKTGEDHIVCGAVSPDGSGIAFSDQQGLHLYQLSPQSDAAHPHDTGAVDPTAEESDLAVSKAARQQQVAVGRAGQKLMRLSSPEDLPTFQELQYRPGCAQVIGLTAQGSLVVLDTPTMTVVHEFSDAIDLLQLAGHSLAVDQAQQAAADQLDGVSNLTVSAGGTWAAVVKGRHVHVFDLQAMTHHGRLPALQDESPLTAIAFSSGGDGLIVANASNHIGVYNVESMAATDWTRTVGAKLPARLLDMPGSIASIAVHPKAAEIVVATPSSACHFSLVHQAPLEAGVAPTSVWGAEYPYQSVNTSQRASDPGENFRVLPMLHPVLMLAYTSPSSLLLVDKPWEEVYKSLPEPLYRHQYGT